MDVRPAQPQAACAGHLEHPPTSSEDDIFVSDVHMYREKGIPQAASDVPPVAKLMKVVDRKGFLACRGDPCQEPPASSIGPASDDATANASRVATMMHELSLSFCAPILSWDADTLELLHWRQKVEPVSPFSYWNERNFTAH